MRSVVEVFRLSAYGVEVDANDPDLCFVAIKSLIFEINLFQCGRDSLLSDRDEVVCCVCRVISDVREKF